MCQKMKFANKKDAKTYHSQQKSLSCKMFTYYCGVCDAWHLTRMSKVNFRKLRKK